MNANYQHLFIIGPVENADPASFGKPSAGPPHEIVVECFGRGRLEREHLAALGIHPGHHVPDDAILARCVHALEDQQKRPAILRVELALQLTEKFDASPEMLICACLRTEAARIAGIHGVQPKAFSVRHPEWYG